MPQLSPSLSFDKNLTSRLTPPLPENAESRTHCHSDVFRRHSLIEKRGRSDRIELLHWTTTKRSLEHAHVFIWALKDFLWLRASSPWLVLFCGLVAFIFQIFQLHLDYVGFKLEYQQGSAFVKESLEEICLTLAMMFWLISNTWWAYGECVSLRESAVFDKTYDAITEQSEVIILFGLLASIVYFYLAFQSEVPYWILRRLRRRGSLMDSGILTGGRSQSYGSLEEPFFSARSHRSPSYDNAHHDPTVVSTSIMPALEAAALLVHRPEPFAHYSNREPNAPSSALIEWPLSSDSFLPSDASLSERQECFEAEESEKSDIGSLYTIEVQESNSPHSFMDSVASSDRIEQITEHTRHFEEAFMFVWIMKDLTWMLEWKYGWLFCATTLASVVIWMGTEYFYSRRFEAFLPHQAMNHVFAMLLLLWISSNIVWAGGELFFTDSVEGIPSGNAFKDLAYEIPPLWAPHKALMLTACWMARWIASWVLASGLTLTVVGVYLHGQISSGISRSLSRRLSL